MVTRTESLLRPKSAAPAATAVLLLATVAAAQGTRPRPKVEPSSPATQAPGAVPAAKDAPAPPRWEWVEGWGDLGAEKEIGSTHGCMIVDGKGRIFVNTDTEDAVRIFAPTGERVGSWGAEWKGGLHGMCLRVEDGTEYLYLAHTGRHEIVKTTLAGEVQWTIGWPEAAGIYGKEDEYKPTAVAVADDGRIYAADGYGRSWVHVYDKDRHYVKSFGGPGKENGKFQTPHGLWLDRRGVEPRLLVCDRENHRLQWFTLDGEFVREVHDGFERPCNVWPLDTGGLAVADLRGRVVVLDQDDKPVVVLGDAAPADQRATNQVARDKWRTGTFFAPHSVCADAKGDLYVMDWNATGRVSKLRRVR